MPAKIKKNRIELGMAPIAKIFFLKKEISDEWGRFFHQKLPKTKGHRMSKTGAIKGPLKTKNDSNTTHANCQSKPQVLF